MEYEDYYKTLGVERDASQKDIQRAFRRLARKHHPDVNPGDKQAEDRFKQVNEAYEVLRDPEKRRKYEQLGTHWRDWQQRGGDASGFDWSRWTTGAPGRVHVQYGDLGDLLGAAGGRTGFSDFFQAIFGGPGGAPGRTGFGAQPRGGMGPRRSRDAEQPVEITLQEAFRGTTRTLQLDGRRVEVRIPPGVDSRSRVRMSGLGGAGGGATGDLYLRITVAPDPRFKRRGNDLVTEVELPLDVAVLGGEAPVQTMEGRIMLKIPPGTQPGKTFRLRGQGMPHLGDPSRRGDLLVKARVRLPSALSDRERRLFEELGRLRESG